MNIEVVLKEPHPSEYAYTRFQRRLRKYEPQVEEMFHRALEELQIELPDLGQVQALDGKELHSLAKGESSYPLADEEEEDTDGRRDRDADWGVKGSGKRRRSWFGYLLHLVVDASYELPLAFEVTTASRAEQPQAQRLLDQMQGRHPELLERCSRLSADKGYDDHKLINRLWDQHQIKPIIAIRNCWQDGEADDDGVVTKLVSGQQNEKESIRVGPANSERWPLPAWPGPGRIGLIELNRAPMGIGLPVWWCR